ncbi:TOPRIM nucleotidyl transferase/hydrolase domain-containing protein, partial [Streptomyces sp. KR55]|uniref:TOPRIM nucleotidyl transferase/hydrolase domain-containing protein n=1 Tax=Streptomyces sp. KR55 TaxID=3457425 RepID=UPI003FD2AE06
MTDMGTFRETVTAWAAGGPGAPAHEPAARLRIQVAVLLEGPSDAAAISALAVGRGRNLAAEGVWVLPMGGATNIGRFARLLGPSGLGLRLTGLCDEAEHRYYARGWERAGAAQQGIFGYATRLRSRTQGRGTFT